MKLSVLDQSPIRSGGTAADALRETIELAQITERLGYHRYWVAEHHGSASFAGSSPEVLISTIAANTSRIRVGSGGVMLMHYSPLKVAENFRLLETLYPGRIDLGIGRAPGSDGITAVALAYGSKIGMEYFPAKLADLKAFINGQPPYTEALSPVRVTPVPDDRAGTLDARIERRRRAARRAFRVAAVVCAFHQPALGRVELSDLSRHVPAIGHLPGAARRVSACS